MSPTYPKRPPTPRDKPGDPKDPKEKKKKRQRERKKIKKSRKYQNGKTTRQTPPDLYLSIPTTKKKKKYPRTQRLFKITHFLLPSPGHQTKETKSLFTTKSHTSPT